MLRDELKGALADKNLLPIRSRHSHSNKHIKSRPEVKYWPRGLVRSCDGVDINFSSDHRHSYRSGESRERSRTPRCAFVSTDHWTARYCTH